MKGRKASEYYSKKLPTELVRICRHCEEPTGPAFGGPDDKLRDEAIHWAAKQDWIASRSLSSGAHSRDPLARNDEVVIVVIATTALKAMNL